jgi:hypothetical protein
MDTSSADDVFAVVDSGDATAFSQLFAETGRMRFGNWDPMTGRESIEQGVAAFFLTIRGLRHAITNQWAVGRDHVAELAVTYERLDGTHVTIPVVTIWCTGEGGLIEDYRVFLDVAPVFA